MALGVAVNGARVPFYEDKKCLEERRTGSSTATPIAAGIAALLIGYARQCMNQEHDIRNFKTMQKLFLAMSTETEGSPVRYLAPWALFEPGQDPKQNMKEIIEAPLGLLF